MKESKDKMIRALNEGLGDPSEVMELLELNTSFIVYYQEIFLNGLREHLIVRLCNLDYSFTNETLTLERNRELICAYIRYNQRLGMKINDLFSITLGTYIYHHNSHIPDLSLLLIRDQVKEIAKPFYTTK